jgi:signal transduction histidine kinase
MVSSYLGPRPLDFVRSVKVKLGIVVVGSVAATVGAIYLSLSFGLHARYAFLGGMVVSLLVIQLLAHGMVLPLREMVAATKAMAAGDYSRRVTATAQDEVGSLASSFNTMAAKLEDVERQRRELIANVSHELRTPIAALRARLENMADGVQALDDEAVGAMLKGTERLSKLVDQLLLLSAFESGATSIDRQRIDLRDVVAEAIAEVRPCNPSVRIVTEVPSGLTGVADQERIHEVLTNLLTNALRHSPPGGEVTVHGSAAPGGVRIEVSDQGSGIPAQDLDKIFDRFYRLTAAPETGQVSARPGGTSPTSSGQASTDSGGAGLGLAIARSIISLHGGSIRALPGVPVGCRIVFDLPS